MSAVDRRRRPALVAALLLPAAAAAGLVLVATGDDTVAPASAPTTVSAPAPATAPPDTTPVDSASVDSAPADSTSTTSAVIGFADANEARTAAEGLIPSYIDSQFQHEVTDAACSKPASGEAGQQFVCYALKPGDLVIALRATIGEERLIDLTLITDQQPTTTTTVAVATTTG